MTEFSDTNWAKPEFSQGYRDNADVFIVERQRMLAILRSCYTHFVKGSAPTAMLDLGCGDGIVTAAVADADPMVAATLVDGSSDMLRKAGERLNGLRRVRFVQATFEEVLRADSVGGVYDFVASSLAIHHLPLEGKRSLFRYAYDHLSDGGQFVNIDVVLAPTQPLENWYLSLWRQWIGERARAMGREGDGFEGVVDGYKENSDNKPDTLEAQLDALRRIGFRDVGCYYKYGVFTIFGGRK